MTLNSSWVANGVNGYEISKEVMEMKKICALIMTFALILSCTVIPAGAVEIGGDEAIASIEIEPREILRVNITETVYVGSQYAAEITLPYTIRNEASNSSGYYITGVLSGSIRNVKGWTAVRNVDFNPFDITYSDNHQVAVVPITYEASIGSGYATYDDIIVIDLNEEF